jgi:endo-1,4-beta-mannosidase
MVDEVLEDTAALGLKVMRTWGFCDGKVLDGYCFQRSPGVYDEPTFQNMDYTIYKAGQCGIKLIIPLVNNWDDMGGMNQYVAWAGGGSHDDFYTNATCKTTYKNYVKYFLTRVNSITGIPYKDDPTIMMWELGNEPRCTSDTTGAKLQAWIDEMAAYIKSLDSKHLLGTGMEGFYNGAEGSNYIKNNQCPNIDVCSAHLYPGYWSLSEAQALTWISDHANDAHNVIGKPFYLGEFGWVADQSSLTKRNQVYTDWYNMLDSTDSDGAMFWLLSGHQDDGTLYPDYDTFTVYYPENSSTCTVIRNYSNVANAKSGITFDNTAPSASITSPANNASVSGTLRISGTATDNTGLSKVEVCFDGGVYRAASGTTASWYYDWDTTKVVNGAHTIIVKATDTQNNTSTTQITVTVTGSSPAGAWSLTGQKTKDDGYWLIYNVRATNTSGAAQSGHFVFRFYIVPDGTTTITSHYDDSSVYNSSVTPSASFTAYVGTAQYYEIDMGTRTINGQQYVGYAGNIGQNDGKFKSSNDWSSAQLPTSWGTITHVALYKDGVLVGGLNP